MMLSLSGHINDVAVERAAVAVCRAWKRKAYVTHCTYFLSRG
jgi:hypothetical protein